MISISNIVQYLKSIYFSYQRLFVSTASKTISNSIVETTLVTTGVGTVSIPENFLSSGKSIKIKAYGYYSSTAAPSGTLRLKLKFGTTTIIDTLANSLDASVSNAYWQFESIITCRSAGALGTVIGQGAFFHRVSDPTPVDRPIIISNATLTAAVTIDTTASNSIDLTAQFDTASASNSISCTNLLIEAV
jgi:hypothetical protein